MDFLATTIGRCLPCVPELLSPTITLNGTKYKVLRLLGEGGFSYVYLVAPKRSSTVHYAMKKIRCPYGGEDATFHNAMREVKSYYRFAALNSPYIIKTIDEEIVSDPSGARTFYILLPYFEKSLQDVLNAHVLGNTHMDQREVLKIFVGVLRGVKTMHTYRRPAGDASDVEDGTEADAMLPGDEESGPFGDSGATELHEFCPYAHRDLKPANVMISAEGLPVLVDLGSCSKARVSVKTRQQALTLTDFAQEHCTLPYRAPELLDVATNSEITEATDVWSLGCILYACCFGLSPFEKLEIEQGANLNVAISQGKFDVPANSDFSPELIDVIRLCLVVDAQRRPSVDTLLERCLLLALGA